MDIRAEYRYIPPDNFIAELKRRCNIIYNAPYNGEPTTDAVISTIPMFAMAKIFPVEIGEFHFEPIYVNRIKIEDCNSHCTIYYPDPDFSPYRASLCGDTLIIESNHAIDDLDIYNVCKSMGLPSIPVRLPDLKNSVQQLGKIFPIDEEKRKHYITNLTLHCGVYSLGRFATWRPKLMLDDVLEDIFVIRRLIEGGNYASLNHQQEEKS